MHSMLLFALPTSWQIGIVLGLLVLAVVLFAIEVLSVDIITLILLLALVGAGILTVREAFAGFSEEIIIILASIFVLSGALQETGVVDQIGTRLIKIAQGGETRLLIVLMLVVAGFSAFMNNTTVTAMMIGPVLGLARSTKVSPSQILLPMAFASILGGTCTLIGTSTNVAVSGFIVREKMEPLGLFEITPIGLIIVAVGTIYMVTIGRRLLPRHSSASLAEGEAIHEYLSEIIVMAESPLIGQKVLQSDMVRLGFETLKIIRGKETFTPTERTVIEEEDILLVVGNAESLMKVKTGEGIGIKADWKMGDLGQENLKIVEAIVTPQSSLVARTLKEAGYHRRTGVTVLAIYRKGHPLREKLSEIRLRVGDLLMVQGDNERLEELQRQRELAVLAELPPAILNKNKGYYVTGFFVGALILGGIGVVPTSMALLGAAVMSLLTRCIAVERIYQFIDWRLIILIGGMTAFGRAIDKTGADEFLSHWIVTWLKPMGVMAIMAGFFVLTILLTQPMSNAAAALVVLPIALATANELGVNERTFAIAIMLAASVSFITPFEPSCILVYGPGKYKFRDFLKVGLPLTIILAVIVLFFVPLFWPLHPK